MIQLVRPCRGHVTQWYGNIQSHDGRKHTGQDFAYFSAGQVMHEVFAAAAGTVLYAGDSRNLGWPNGWYLNPDFDRSDAVDSSAGNVVILGHKQGIIPFDTTYNHVADWNVKAGDTVRAGQRIATIGDSGFSAGKHLHFELMFRPFNFGTETYGRADPNPYFIAGGGLAAQGTTITPVQEDDVSAQDVLSWPIERTDGQKSTVAVELAKIGPDQQATQKAIRELNETLKALPTKIAEATMRHPVKLTTGHSSDLLTELAALRPDVWAALSAIGAVQVAGGSGVDADAVAADIRQKLAEQIGGK